MKKLFCLNNISKIGLQVRPNHYDVTADINEADAVLVRSASMHEMALPKETLAVARAGAGVNNIPLDEYARKGVVVFNTPGANANAVKELTIAGMFLAARNLYPAMQWVSNNTHDTDIAKTVEKAKSQFAGTEIIGKTIGVYGMGAIGIAVAKACQALGMTVYTAERNFESKKQEAGLYPKTMIAAKSKEEFFGNCDYISLNLALSPDTKGFINKEVFGLMKDGAILLNFARAALVNDTDLKEALESKKLRAYVTDFPTYETANTEGVINIPHLGASTEEAEDNCAMMAVNQLVDFIDNGNIINSVNYPNLDAGPKTEAHRLTILHANLEQLQDEVLRAIHKHGKVARTVTNQYKELAYTVVDLSSFEKEQVANLEKLEGVYRIRLI